MPLPRNSETSNAGVTHLTTNETMNLGTYGFQRVTRASTIARRVVTETKFEHALKSCKSL
jgi:hypothetical protein